MILSWFRKTASKGTRTYSCWTCLQDDNKVLAVRGRSAVLAVSLRTHLLDRIKHPADKRFYDLLGGLNFDASFQDLLQKTQPMVNFKHDSIFNPFLNPLFSFFDYQ